MNNTLASIIDNHCPKFNKRVTDGNIKDILKKCPEYLDAVFRSSIKSLSSSVDLVYDGCRRLTPEEEYRANFVGTPPKAQYDIAVSDLYMVEFQFTYCQKDVIKKPVYLPYANEGNILKISDVVYAMMPVLSDTVISPSSTKVFVRLLKDKLTFESYIYNVMINGNKEPKSLIYTTIIKTSKMKLMDYLGKVMSAASLYLLGKYGFIETIKRYVHTDNVIVTNKNVDHLREEYDVYESCKVPPRNLKDRRGYEPNEVKICIHKSVGATSSQFLENFIVGTIYTLDALSFSANDFVEAVESGNVRDEIDYWRICLGRIAYNNTFSVDRYIMDANSHFTALEGYLDSLIKEKLKENNVIVDNFFDLIYSIMEKFNVWLLGSKMYNSDLSNRYIDIYYYILYDIIVGFNKVILNINKRVDKKIGGPLDLKEINRIFNNDFGVKKIFSIVKSSQISLAVQSISDYTLDIKYPKITALLEDQSCGEGVRRASKAQFPEATKTLKAQQMFLGSLEFLSKSKPSPVFKANLYMKYNEETGRLLLDRPTKLRLEKLESLLKGRIVDDRIEILESDTNNETMEEQEAMDLEPLEDEVDEDIE